MNKSPLEVIDAFTSKMKKINRGDQFSLNSKNNSKTEKLQNHISEIQKIQEEQILKTYHSYVVPVSKDIEEAEDELLRCYKEFKALRESPNSTLPQFIESSLPKNEGYTIGRNLIYLLAWFMFENNAKDFIPCLYKNKNGFFRLTFIPFEEMNLTIEEKRILSVIENSIN